MSAPALSILAPIRTAIVGSPYIVARIGQYNGEPSVHTRRPVPSDAGYPMITVVQAARTDEDGVNTWRPLLLIDLICYGEQKAQYREVEEVGEALYALFHRQRRAITVANYSVTDLRCSGPSPAPVDDESRVGRRVTLTARLFAKY